MKRFLLLVAVAAVAGAMYVAAAPGSQQSRGPTAKQFAALKKQVAALGKTVKAVKTLAVAEAGLLLACDQEAIPINQFGDGLNQTEGYRYSTTAEPSSAEILTTALDVSDKTDPGAVFITAGDTSCDSEFSSGALRHAAAHAGVQLPHVSLHASFATHRP